MSYEMEMGDHMSPELAAGVAEYAKNRYQDGPVASQTQEELCRLHEANEDTAKQYQWLNPDEYDDEKARIGTPMHSDKFISTLRDADVQCWYAAHPHPDKLVLLVAHRNKEREVACWVQAGYMQELSVMNFDEFGAPLAEKRRGWRTPLLQLILKGFISETKANKVFGRPRETRAYARYNGILKSFRDAGNCLSE